MLALSGWKAGEGLGKHRKRNLIPIIGEEEGQVTKDKTGIGYYGEKVVFAKPSVPAPKTGYNCQTSSTWSQKYITSAFSRKMSKILMRVREVKPSNLHEV